MATRAPQSKSRQRPGPKPLPRDEYGCASAAWQMWYDGEKVWDIRAHFRVDHDRVIRWLSWFGIDPRKTRMQTLFAQRAALDWTQSNRVLAERTGLSLSSIAQWRRKLKQASLSLGRRRVLTRDELIAAGAGRSPDELVAATLGVGRDTVGAARKKHRILAMPEENKLRSVIKRLRSGPAQLSPDEVEPARQAAELWRAGTAMPEIIVTFGVRGESVRRWLRAHGIRPLADAVQAAREKWEAVDWTQPDGDIAKELGAGMSTVVTWRHRLGKVELRPEAERIPGLTLDRLLAAGMGRDVTSVVAARVGVTATTVRNWARRAGVELPDFRRRFTRS